MLAVQNLTDQVKGFSPTQVSNDKLLLLTYDL